jgi:hypothetical protein
VKPEPLPAQKSPLNVQLDDPLEKLPLTTRSVGVDDAPQVFAGTATSLEEQSRIPAAFVARTKYV